MYSPSKITVVNFSYNASMKCSNRSQHLFHCRPVDGATVMATKLVVEIEDAASRVGLSRVGYFIPLNAAR